MMREALLVFVRRPRPGETKTRLIPALGAEVASELYRALAERVIGVCRRLIRPGLRRIVCFTPPSAGDQLREWIGAGFDYWPQPEGDLGERMGAMTSRAFEEGAARVALLGTDCPYLDEELLHRGLDALTFYDASIGDAEDGGYYFLGLARPMRELFEGVPWSSPRTAEETKKKLADQRAWVFRLPVLADVDRPEDLRRLEREMPELFG